MLEKRIITAASVFVLALTGVIALSVRVFGIGLPGCLNVKPFKEPKVLVHAPNRIEVHYVARMWKFEPAEISVRPGATVDIYLATLDVTHGMQIVGTNVNLMAVPGAVNYARVTFDKPGEYLVVCNEYCGISHHNMAGKIRVIADAVTEVVPAVAPAVAQGNGAELLEKNLCTACHSIDGVNDPAPSFKGLYGSTRTLANGQTAAADDAYIIESIVNPDAKVVKGFDPGVMPASDLSTAELRAIVDYLRTLQ